jgi:transposase
MKENSNTYTDEIRVVEALEQMKIEAGEDFSLATVNLAELERRTGISRARLRRLKENGFVFQPHGNKGKSAERTVLTGYSGALDDMLRNGITNSSVCFERLQQIGYSGSLTVVKTYIGKHRDLIPAQRQLVAPQGNRGRRYTTPPGEAFQMDWGFVKVKDQFGNEFTAACFVMVCHHCGVGYIEFFPNAKQENLFIGMIHAFQYMGAPEYVLTDNMKSVVVRRDLEGKPIWQVDYEAFMLNVGFKTKLCKPRHPFTKGKVERLVRFVKGNFLAGRTFWNVTDLNRQALEWCDKQNSSFHRAIFGVPNELHQRDCVGRIRVLEDSDVLREYLCPARKVSFDGFVNYEGRRFGVPYSYTGSVVRVMRQDDTIYIYSADLRQCLTTHEVTWSKYDRYCKDQFVALEQPEEFPTMPVKSSIQMLKPPEPSTSFEKFNFDKGVKWDD